MEEQILIDKREKNQSTLSRWIEVDKAQLQQGISHLY